ncbi:MAG: hypothetical protein HUJ76_10770, partial [Parasporobacterium sp.]|nr:hypothetical protein [Parasporobacterium sp.]
YAGALNRALAESQQLYSVLDSSFNTQTVDKEAIDLLHSSETATATTLRDLDKKFGIDYHEINVSGRRVKTLSEAVAKAVAITEKRIDALENQAETVGNGTAVKDQIRGLKKTKYYLMRELESGKYYSGLTRYLSEAYDYIDHIREAIENRPTNGTEWENAMALSRLIEQYYLISNGYNNLFRTLLTDLSEINKLDIDESISQTDKAAIKTEADRVIKLLKDIGSEVERLNENNMRSILTQLMPGTERAVIDNIVGAYVGNTWLTDGLYSINRLSDPMSAAIGTLVRNTQDKRDEALRQMTVRIREYNSKLNNAGHTSEFMYEDDGHILSDYDWSAYQDAYRRAKKDLKRKGYTEEEIEDAMELWEESNTEELPVDVRDGNTIRTERVPNFKYRKDYAGRVGLDGYQATSFRDFLTKDQLEYYDNMMQLKGEVGTLLPAYAQQQFLPPQIRRDFFTAVGKEAGLSKEAMKKTAETLEEKIEEMFKVKEDDVDWGVLNGTKEASLAMARGDLSGDKAKYIPIFFVRRLSKQEELFKNFSVGLQALAATAQNYHYMSDIVDVAEYMRTYSTNKSPQVVENFKALVEETGSKKTKVRTIVSNQDMLRLLILNNLMDKHFYGINEKSNPLFTKIMKDIVHYTSFKGLATNWVGGTANLLVGQVQLGNMALANSLYAMATQASIKAFFKQETKYFNITDFALGLARLFGEPLVLGAAAVSHGLNKIGLVNKPINSVLVDLMTRDKTSMDYLLAERFNLFNENYGSMMHAEYFKGFRRFIHDISFILYGAGEKAIRYNTLWAMMHNRKVMIDGVSGNLRDAFMKTGYYGAPTVVMKPNVTAHGITITDAKGNLTEEGEAYMTRFT